MFGKKVKLRITFLLLSIVSDIILKFSGMVKKNSIEVNAEKVSFIITDFKNDINVTYSGIIPNLFGEEKGVVAEGFIQDKEYFVAKKILAKHDENYMPPEVKQALEVND